MFLSSSTLAGRRLPTAASAYQAMLVARLPVGPVTLRPSAGVVWRRYSVGGDVVPDVSYMLAGAGLEAALKVRFVVVELGGAVRWVLAAGELTSAAWFPASTAIDYAAAAR